MKKLWWITFKGWDCAGHCHSHEERTGIRADTKEEELKEFWRKSSPEYCSEPEVELAEDWMQDQKA